MVTQLQGSWPPRRSRNLRERLMVRFPSLFRRQAAFLSRLSPRSRLRRILLRRAVLSGWASFDRRDLELNFLYFAPDCEFEFPPAMQTLGLPASFRGLEGRNEGINKLFEVWARSWNLFTCSTWATVCSILGSGTFGGARAECRSTRSSRS